MRKFVIMATVAMALASCGDGGPSAPPPQADATPAEKTEQAKAFVDALTVAASGCDQASQAVGSGGAADMVSLYETAKAAEDACLNTHSRLRDVPPPAYLSKEGREKLKAGQDKLGDAYLQKWALMGQFKKIADGDMKASTISETKQGAERFQALSMMAFGEIFGVLGEEGADSKAMLQPTAK